MNFSVGFGLIPQVAAPIINLRISRDGGPLWEPQKPQNKQTAKQETIL
jgi:hypothetical protein